MAQTPDLTDASIGTQLLSRVMVRIRHKRPPLGPDQTQYVRIDDAMGTRFAQLWFLTRGCTWDRRGACTMCNYGTKGSVSADEMVGYVEDGLASITEPIDDIYVSPSGSLLDGREVPAEALSRILALVNLFPAPRFSFETRAKTVTDHALQHVARQVPSKTVSIGFGLESASDWVLSHCINKPLQPAHFRRAAAVTQRHGMHALANVSLGAAFLTTAEAIEDARSSVEWALQNGASTAILFPMNVKGHTLLAWLCERDLYRPPSLWSLVEVLQSIDRQLIPRITISWYRSDYGKDPGVVASPTTCRACENRVLSGLDEFRARPDDDSLDELLSLTCRCRDLWQMEVLSKPERPLPERVLGMYDLLAREFGLDDWWREHRPEAREELRIGPT